MLSIARCFDTRDSHMAQTTQKMVRARAFRSRWTGVAPSTTNALMQQWRLAQCPTMKTGGSAIASLHCLPKTTFATTPDSEFDHAEKRIGGPQAAKGRCTAKRLRIVASVPRSCSRPTRCGPPRHRESRDDQRRAFMVRRKGGALQPVKPRLLASSTSAARPPLYSVGYWRRSAQDRSDPPCAPGWTQAAEPNEMPRPVAVGAKDIHLYAGHGWLHPMPQH